MHCASGAVRHIQHRAVFQGHGRVKSWGVGGGVSRITSCTKFSISAPTYNTSGATDKVALARQARRRTAPERSRGFGAGRQSPAPLPRRWGGSAVRGAPVGRGEDKAPRGHARLHPPHGAGAPARPPRGAPRTAGAGKAGTHGVQRSLYSLAIVSIPPLRATAM